MAAGSGRTWRAPPDLRPRRRGVLHGRPLPDVREGPVSFVDLHAALPGLRGHRIHVVGAADEANLRAALTGAGFEIVTAAGSAITSEGTLFEEMARAFRFP